MMVVPITFGAVNVTFVPEVALRLPPPLSIVQVTALLNVPVPVTVTVNNWLVLPLTSRLIGLMLTAVIVLVTTILTVTFLLVSCTLVTRTIVVPITFGAVNVTFMPEVALRFPAPLSIAHVTALLNEPVPVTDATKVEVSAPLNVTCDALMLIPVMLEGVMTALMFKVISAVLLGSCTLVARTIVVLESARLGALKVMGEPVVAESVPPPLTMLQLTAVLKTPVPVTMALNSVFAAAFKVVITALAVTFVMVVGTTMGLTVIVTVSALLESALLVAVIVTLVVLVTVGAVKVLTLPVVLWNVPALLVHVTALLNAPVPVTSAETA